jgi:hypothetical protein
MKTTATLVLAAVTALSLGFGSAMAQNQTPSAAQGAYFSGQRQAAPKIVDEGSGSSDVDTIHSGARPHFDYSTLGDPG